MAIRIFAINDCEWWAGDCSPEQILAVYCEANHVTHEEATGDATQLPIPLSNKDMNRLKYMLDDAGNLLPKPISFKERLERCIARGDRFPAVFAVLDF